MRSVADERKVGDRGKASLRTLLVDDALGDRRVQRRRRLNRSVVLPTRRRGRRCHARRGGRDKHEQRGNDTANGGQTSQLLEAILHAVVIRITPPK